MKFATYDTAATIREKVDIYYRRKEAYEKDPQFHYAYVDLVSEEKTPDQNTLCLRMLHLACRIGKVELAVFPEPEELDLEPEVLTKLLEEFSEKGIHIAFGSLPVPNPEDKEEAYRIRNRIEGELLIAAITLENCYVEQKRGLTFVTLEKDVPDCPEPGWWELADVLAEHKKGFLFWLAEEKCWYYVNQSLAEGAIAAANVFWETIEEEMLSY